MNYVIIDRFHSDTPFVCKDYFGALYLGNLNNAFIYKSLSEAHIALANDLPKDVDGNFVILRLRANGACVLPDEIDKKFQYVRNANDLTVDQKTELLLNIRGTKINFVKNILRKFDYDYSATEYFLLTGKSPFYYVISSNLGTTIVENEDVAKDFCERNDGNYQTFRVDEKYL